MKSTNRLPENPLTHRSRPRGFALIVTLSLMILLTVIAVGLLSLASISLRTSSHGEAMATARANARVALMLAIGDLQKQLGPDGRITSAAEQHHSDKSGNRSQWIGVHDAWIPDPKSSARTSPQKIADGTRPKPVFHQWLASGDPTSLINETMVDSPSTNDVLLVGAGTLGKIDTPDQEVRVPKVNMKNSRNIKVGSMAWWVSDESMKAAIPSGGLRGKDYRKTTDDALFGTLAAARPNPSLLASFKDAVASDTWEADVSKFKSFKSFKIKVPNSNQNFYDVTELSQGVLADVTRGRLKKDLSLLFLQPRKTVQDVPLYDGSGNINDVDVDVTTGKPKNTGVFTKFSDDSAMLKEFAKATQPGINLEELWIYSNLYRQLKWSEGIPTLEAKSGAEDKSAKDFRYQSVSDPSFNYWKPIIASQQYMFSLGADKANPAYNPASKVDVSKKFDMKLKLDAVFTFWNPLNIKVSIPPGDFYCIQLTGIPFKIKWQITDADNKPKHMKLADGATGKWPYPADTFPMSRASNAKYDQTVPTPSKSNPNDTTAVAYGFNRTNRLNLGGRAGRKSAIGYSLGPGECGFFGYAQTNNIKATGSTGDYDLAPGWGTTTAGLDANVGANALDGTDKIYFDVTPDQFFSTSTSTSAKSCYSTTYIGERTNDTTGSISPGLGKGGLQLGDIGLYDYVIKTPSQHPRYFPTINPTQNLQVNQFTNGKYKPFMLFANYLNAETDDATNTSQPGWPRLMKNSAVINGDLTDTSVISQIQENQQIWRVDSLPYTTTDLISIHANNLGYFGGGHSVSNGVNYVATRQITPTPLVSLMSLSHAIANGFADRFSQFAERANYPSSSNSLSKLIITSSPPLDKFTSSSVAFSAQSYLFPQVERAIGNSFASPFLATSKSFSANNGIHFGLDKALLVPVVDHSYLANTALFDSWFLSSVCDDSLVPSTAPYKAGGSDPQQMLQKFFQDPKQRLINPHYVPSMTWTDAKKLLVDGSKLKPDAAALIAACLLNDGAFNVNSTRKNAWKALLASNRGGSKLLAGKPAKDDKLTPTGGSGLAAAGPSVTPTSLNETEQWSGYRALTDDEIESLAKAVVTQVKARGPFLSVADFLNRNPSASEAKQRNMGAVQAAIESTDLNSALSDSSRSVSSTDFTNLAGADAADGIASSTSRAIGIPGYLMQSDVLTPIASQLQVRGDTFRIRSHGSSVSPDGKVNAEAWCEAVVQRTPSWIDSSELPNLPEASLTKDVNKTFGRRFEIVSFRWLSKNEI